MLKSHNDPASIRWINGDQIGFTYKMKNIKAETDTTYYISAGQTSLLRAGSLVWTGSRDRFSVPKQVSTQTSEPARRLAFFRYNEDFTLGRVFA